MSTYSTFNAIPAVPLATPKTPAADYVFDITKATPRGIMPLGHLEGPYIGGDAYYTPTASANTQYPTNISLQGGEHPLQYTSSPYSFIQRRTESHIYTPFQRGEHLGYPFQATTTTPSTLPAGSLSSLSRTYNRHTPQLPLIGAGDVPQGVQRAAPWAASSLQQQTEIQERRWRTVSSAPLRFPNHPLSITPELQFNKNFITDQVSEDYIHPEWPNPIVQHPLLAPPSDVMAQSLSGLYRPHTVFPVSLSSALSSNPPPSVIFSSEAHKAGPPIPVHLNGNIPPTHITHEISSSSTSNMRAYKSLGSGDMARGQYFAVGEIMPSMLAATQEDLTWHGVEPDVQCEGEEKQIQTIDFDLASSAGHTTSSEEIFVELPTNWAQQMDQSGLFGQPTHPPIPQGQVLSPSYGHIPSWSSDSELNWALTPRDSQTYPPSSSSPTSSTSSPNSTQAADSTPATNAGPAERPRGTQLSTRGAKVSRTSSGRKRKRDEVQVPSSSQLTASTPLSQPKTKKQRVEPRLKKKTNNQQCSPLSSSSSSSSQPTRGRGRPAAPPRPPPRAPGDYPPIQPRPPGFPSTPTLFLARPSKGKGLLIPRPRAASGTPAQRKVGGVGRKEAKVSRALTPDKHSMDLRALISSPGIVRVGP